MKFSKMFWLPIAFLVADIILRLYILWLSWTKATNSPDFYPITKGVNFPEIQFVQIGLSLFLILFLFFLKAKNFVFAKTWIRLHLAYILVMVGLMFYYGGNVIGFYNVFILNFISIEMRKIVSSQEICNENNITQKNL